MADRYIQSSGPFSRKASPKQLLLYIYHFLIICCASPLKKVLKQSQCHSVNVNQLQNLLFADGEKAPRAGESVWFLEMPVSTEDAQLLTAPRQVKLSHVYITYSTHKNDYDKVTYHNV